MKISHAMRWWSVMVALLMVALQVGCRGEESETFPDLTGPEVDVQGIAWIVEGMSCQGGNAVRMVKLVEAEDTTQGREVVYARGDDCVEAGAPLWPELPASEGQEVTLLAGGEESIAIIRHQGDWRFVMEAEGDDVVEMIPVTEEISPSLIPDLSGVDLAGRWWMEGYPCMEELVPQLVQVMHPPGSVHFSKIIGDECVGSDQSFFDGQLSGTSLTGEASLEEEGGIFDDEVESYEVTGRVRTENYFRLDVGGQAVTFRRVLDAEDS